MSFRALTFKAWRINLRHYFQSLFQIILPLIPFMILVYTSDNGPNKSWEQSEIIYNKTWKNDILSHSGSDLDVVYFPNNDFTRMLMKNVQAQTGGKSMAVNDESDIEKWFINKTDSYFTNSFGVIFHVEESSTKPPAHFSYTMRGMKNKLPDANSLFPINPLPGPNEAGMRYFGSQFLCLKVAIDDSFLNEVNIPSPNWSIQEFPYPAHGASGAENNQLAHNLPMLIAALFIYTFTTLASFSVNEKKSGITERLRMVGLNDFMILFNYLIHSFMIYIISTVLLTLLLKAGAIPIFNSSNFLVIWLVMILFCLQSSAFFLAISALFNNPTLAASLTILIYICPSASVISGPDMSIAGQTFSSLLPVVYLFWTFQVIDGFEGSGVGATFSTIIKLPAAGYCDIPLLLLMLISLFGTLLYCIIYIYIVNVKPGPYGYAKPWHFIFPKKYFCRVTPSNLLKNENEIHESSKGLYEKVPDNVEVGLRIANLHKRFGNVISVKDLSLDIYVGQITALLGHNGAGKTTTLSIVTGMFKPTKGTIHYRGYDIFSNLNTFRQDLGLCPQEDMLINGISVWEHLMIFGMIKKLSSKELKASGNAALSQTGLTQKKNVLIDKLSGGMKRKLCLALALVGDPKVLILDEPTSGLDPESRREIWNIILKFRENKVVILTTHFMEEADALGDQIAIMDHGEIKCYGTPMFLKKYYGAGYQITCCSSPSKFDDIVEFITTSIPSFSVVNKSDEHIVFSLPSSYSEVFPKIFKELESNFTFEITHIGITCTTMDDVFMKVREEANKSSSVRNTSIDECISTDVPDASMRDANPVFSFFQRLFALIYKNIMYVQDRWFHMLVMVVILPLLFSYWLMSNTSAIFNSESNSSITFALNDYGSTEVLLDGSKTPEIRESFTKLIQNEGHNYLDVKKTLNKNNIIDGLLYVAESDELRFRKSFIIAGGFNETTPNILYSSLALHSPVIAINLLYNTILKVGNGNYSISTTSHPLTFTSGICAEIQTSILMAMIFWIVWSYSVCAVIGSTVIKSPHNERTSLLKHLELMTGLSPITYWLSFFLWDLIVYCFAVGLMFIMFKSFDSVGLLALDNASGVLALILILFGISGIWMAYCFSFIFKTPASAFNLFSTGCLIIYAATLICFNFIPSNSKWVFVTYLLRLIPSSPFCYALQLFIIKAMTKFQCKTCPNAYNLPQCHLGNEHESFLDADLKYELYYLGLDWIIYFILIMLAECGILAKLWNKLLSARIGLIEHTNLEIIESDVAKERDRVDNALQSDGNGNGAPIVIVDGLAKKYTHNFTAVYDVSFASNEGECFGLLGVNGAGKTTTFNILSGITIPTQGRALIKGLDLNENKKLCLSYMGYCPQFSALGEGLTGRQMLKLFAYLRLAKSNLVEILVKRWIILLGLEEYADRICGTYSGGNKRKLSTALAFINNPAVILLDEPTSGVDPVTRRNLWTVLKKCQNNKQTIIISSHSMDECEAVCDRLTIMARGYMQCIGNTQHLKSLYGQGFIILIKLNENSDDERSSLKQMMFEEFGVKVSLKDEHVMLLHYHINDPSCQLSSLFTIMERIKKNFQIIDEYSISDSSLEHVFLSFAKKKDNN